MYCNIKMNFITSWWIQCLQDNTWWPKTRNNIVHKDTFMNHYITYLESIDLDDRVSASRQIFWETFYTIQPIANNDKIIRRVVKQADGTMKREPHIRLPRHNECLAMMNLE